MKTTSSFFDVIDILIKKYWHVLTAFVALVYMVVGIMLDMGTLKETVRQHEVDLGVTKSSVTSLREDLIILKEQSRSYGVSMEEIKKIVEKIDERLAKQ